MASNDRLDKLAKEAADGALLDDAELRIICPDLPIEDLRRVAHAAVIKALSSVLASAEKLGDS